MKNENNVCDTIAGNTVREAKKNAVKKALKYNLKLSY